MSAKFQLIRADTPENFESSQKGDYVKIDFPELGSKAGKGYEWVQVEDIEDTATDDSEGYGIRCAHQPILKHEITMSPISILTNQQAHFASRVRETVRVQKYLIETQT